MYRKIVSPFDFVDYKIIAYEVRKKGLL